MLILLWNILQNSLFYNLISNTLNIFFINVLILMTFLDYDTDFVLFPQGN